MKKIICALVAVLFAAAGLSIGSHTPAQAAYGNSATCVGPNKWYIHGPFPVGGGMQSWGTVVPAGTTGPPQDWVGTTCSNFNPSPTRIDQIQLEIYNPITGNWQIIGINYEAWRTIGLWGNTVVAAAGGACQSGRYYRTGYEFAGSPVYYTNAYAPC